VIKLHQRGTSLRAIASQLGLNRKTVRYWLRAEQFPERQVTQRHSSVDRWLSYLEQRWAEGCHNRSQLWRELRAQGADFAPVTLRRWFRVRLGVRGHPPQSSLSPPRKRPSPRQSSALLLGLVHNPSPSQQSFAQTLCALSPDIATTVKLRRHGSCNLVIAAAGETKGNGRGHQYDLDWLEICGLSGDNQREAKQRSTWSHGDDLPEYDLEISIVGDSGQKAYTQVFTVRPGRTAAIEMLPKQ